MKDDPDPSVPDASNSVANDDVLIYFPCKGGIPYSWVRDLSGVQHEKFRTQLLVDQYEWQTNEKNGPNRYLTCGCIENPDRRAKFAIRKRVFPDERPTEYSLARFPKHGTDHGARCRCRSTGFDFPKNREVASDDEPRPGRTLGKDFHGLLPGSGDPELRALRKKTSPNDYKRRKRENETRRSSKTHPSLRTLGTYLLEQSGVCSWSPGFEKLRDERVFNGLIAKAVESLKESERENRFTRLLARLGSDKVVPWSFYRSGTGTEKSLKLDESVVAYGFVSHLGNKETSGARWMTIRSNPDQKLLMAAAVIEESSTNDDSPFKLDELPFPIWAIFVAKFFSGVLKVTAIEWFRVTRRGAIPVTTNEEEKMVEFLMARRRRFRRLLLAPTGTNYVPDFQLLDTVRKEYIEVAGLMENPEYAEKIGDKVEYFGEKQMCVWDTRTSLRTFEDKYPDVFGTESHGA